MRSIAYPPENIFSYSVMAYAGPVTFGANLKRMRVASGLSQGALACAMSVRQGTLSDWERDRRGLPETPTLINAPWDLLTMLDRFEENARRSRKPSERAGGGR